MPARLVAAAALGGVAAWLALLLLRRLRERRLRLPSPPSHSVVEARSGVCAWALSDLAALELFEHNLLFVYKQADLQLDRPDETVSLQAQLCARYPSLRDGATAHGFRLIHQLDCATSGVLAVGLTKKAAARGSKLFSERKAVKCYLALVHGAARRGGGMRPPTAAFSFPSQHFFPSQPLRGTCGMSLFGLKRNRGWGGKK
jgi:hypothetical protein